MRLLVWIILILLIAPALAQHDHGADGLPDWYDPACCNQRDCRPTADADIEFGIDHVGAYARHKPTGAVFYRVQWRISQDERYHVCITPDGRALCFYNRAGA